MSAESAITREAWWGGNRAAGGRPDLVHVVEWPAGRDHGYALCGKHLGCRVCHGHVEGSHSLAGGTGLQTYPLGTAAQLRVKVCTPCQTRLAAKRPAAPVVPIQSRRKRRVTA